jgi:hypothetical protein
LNRYYRNGIILKYDMGRLRTYCNNMGFCNEIPCFIAGRMLFVKGGEASYWQLQRQR